MLEVVALQNGAAMNQSIVVVQNGSDSDLCQVRLRFSPSGSDVIEETWSGVARNMKNFLTILQAGAIDDPNSSNLRQPGNCYYDYSGSWFQQAITAEAVPSTPAGFVRLIARLPKANLTLGQSGATVANGGGSDLCQLTLSLQAGSTLLRETWNNLPRNSAQMTDILTGKGGVFDYAANTTISKSPYKIPTGSGWVWLVKINNPTTMGKVSISVTGLASCVITLGEADGSNQWTVETWKNMPRDGKRIVDILQGGDTKYDYGANASSTPTPVNLSSGSQLFTPIDAQSNGLVEAIHLEYVPTLVGGSTLFQTLNDATGSVTNSVATTTQGIAATGSPAISDHASSLFTFALTTRVADVGSLTLTNTPGSGAHRLQEGKDSAWVRARSEYSLAMSYSCIDFPQGKLDFNGNMTLEAWVNPDRLPTDTFSRILHYHSNNMSFALGLNAPPSEQSGYSFFAGRGDQAAVTTATAIPFNQWSHLAATYSTGQCVLMNGVNLINVGNDISQNTGANLTLEMWAQFPASRSQNFILLNKFGSQIDVQSYQLSYESGYLVFRVVVSRQVGKSSPQSIQVSQQFNPDLGWQYISATGISAVKTDSDGITTTDITLAIYVNGVLLGTAEKTENLSGNIQIQPSTTSLTIGAKEFDAANPIQPMTQPFKIAEARLWRKALSATDIWNNFNSQCIAVEATDLVSYWPMLEGQGLEIADEKKTNMGVLSSSKIWEETAQGSSWHLYLNGQKVDSSSALMSEFGGYGSDNWFRMGSLKYAEDLSYPLLGYIDEVCIWNLARTEEQLRNTMFATMGGSEDKLMGYWNFNQGSGTVLPDQTGQALNGQFIEEKLTEFQAKLTLYNSQTVTMKIRFGGDVQVQGYSLVDGEYHISVNVGNRNTMWLELVPDTATINLSQNSGTWQTFSNQSRPQLVVGNNVDLAFKPSDVLTITSQVSVSIVLSMPSWNAQQTAPVGEEAPRVLQIVNGHGNPRNVNIQDQPVVVEYGDLQMDSNNNLYGVMSRSYMFLDTSSKIQMVTGFKVGDLDLQFIGQVQTRPSLIGYIEGPPPVPSENLTVDNPVVDDYVGTTSISLTEKDGVQYHYQSNDETTFDLSTEFKIGAYGGTKMSAGVAVQSEVSKFELQVGLHGSLKLSTGTVAEKRIVAGSEKTLLNKVDCCGAWEVPKDYNHDGTSQYLNSQVGRRYIPNNMGYALVKSGTADLFALRLKRKKTVVSYQVVPNANIPLDFNVIMFPINSGYVKNGTLDGMVGLVADDDYPSAILGERGSYFKPVEAYRLKEQIDLEESQVQAYFDQTSTSPSTPEGELLRDWNKKLSKRSLFNTYVWTAPGGLYSEERQFSDVQSSSSGSTFYIQGMAGIALEGKFRAGGVGIFYELDLLLGGHFQEVKVSGSEQTNTFGLLVSVTGEGWLNQWNAATKQYESFDCPGKVDIYRFMTYRLAPKEEYFDTFFSKVVDDNWLRTSNSPHAIALNEVKYGDKNPVWRVLHRVTFVSRVPPPFEPAPVESDLPIVYQPIDLEGNAWLLQLIKDALRSTPNPTPNQIGTVVDTTLDETLVTLSPSWADFYRRAQDPVAHQAEAKILQSIRLDVKRYFIDYFESLASS